MRNFTQTGLFFLMLCLSILGVHSARADLKPLALVFDGPSICDGCAQALGTALRFSNFRVKYVEPGEITPENLVLAKLFAVPGGDEESEVMQSFKPGEAEAIRDFVSEGGSYLGVCLGGFLAAPRLIDIKNTKGLGLFPGKVHNHSETKEPRLDLVNWNGTQRYMYFQDGPDFTFDRGAKVDIWARYSDGKVAAFQVQHGRGKTGLIGVHPEAVQAWLKEDHLKLPNDEVFHQSFDFFSDFIESLVE